MSLVDRDGSKIKKSKESATYNMPDIYKHKFSNLMIDALKDMLPSIAHRDITVFGTLSSRELAYDFKGSVSGTQFFNIFEFIDRLNLALVKLGITFSLVHIDDTMYSLTTHSVKKTKNNIMKKDKSTKTNIYVDMTRALEILMKLYIDRKKFVAGATCY